ncbi:MAG: hypothetical protein FVQ82_16710 [Planctomycetes bacterium]|nr:hypothetical protein [Planctomycetota bacterium]
MWDFSYNFCYGSFVFGGYFATEEGEEQRGVREKIKEKGNVLFKRLAILIVCVLVVVVILNSPALREKSVPKKEDRSQRSYPAIDLPKVPAPDFKEPVDYIAWYKLQIKPTYLITTSKDKEMEALDEIGWQIPRNAKKQLDTIVLNPRLWKKDEYKELASYLDSMKIYSSKHLTGYYHKKPIFKITEDSDHIFKVVIYTHTKMFCRTMIADIWNENEFSTSRFLKGIDAIISDAKLLKKSSSGFLYLEACRLEEWAYNSIYQAAKDGLLSADDKKSLAKIISDACNPNTSDEIKLLKSCFATEKASNYDILQLMVSDSKSSKPKFDKSKVEKLMQFFYGKMSYEKYYNKYKAFLKDDPADILNDIDAYFNDGINLIANSEVFSGEEDLAKEIDLLIKNIMKKTYFQAFSLYHFPILYGQLKKTRTVSIKACSVLKDKRK